MTATICGTPMTIEDITSALNAQLGTNAKIESYDAEVVGLQQGFMSKVVRLYNVKYSNGGPKRLPSSMIAKIPSMDKLTEVMKALDKENAAENKALLQKGELVRKVGGTQKMSRVGEIQATRCEIAVYKLFMEHGKPTSKICDFYGANTPNADPADDTEEDRPSFLLLQDLSDYKTGDFLAGLTKEQLMEFADAMADVHAWSIKNAALWHGDKDMNFDVTMFLPTNEKHTENYEALNKMAADSTQVQQIFGADLIARIDEYKMEHLSVFNKFDEAFLPSLMPHCPLPMVMNHGDAHPFNVMFDVDSEGCPGNTMKALIDWQVTRLANLMNDFVRVLTISPEDQLRREHWPDVFSHWFDRLEKNLREELRLGKFVGAMCRNFVR